MWRSSVFPDTKINSAWRSQVPSCLILYILWPCYSDPHRVGHFLQDCIPTSQPLCSTSAPQWIKYRERRPFVRSLLTVGCTLRLWINLAKHQYWGNHPYAMWKWVTTVIIGDPDHQSKPKRNLWGKKASGKEIQDFYTFDFKFHFGN